MFTKIAFVVVAIAAVACAENLLKSPCENLFKYEKQEAGEWIGELTLKSEFNLYGLWIRLFLENSDNATLKLLDSFGDVHSNPEEKGAYLIKNRSYVLKKNEPVKVRFAVKYDSKVEHPPALSGFRLNARNICPEGQD